MSAAIVKETKFEQLTNMAMEEATQGKWDSVAKFYEQRASAGSLEAIPRDIAKKLIQSDQWIMSRIREVQTLTQQQLREAQQHRRQLEGVKRQWASQHPGQPQYRLSV